VIHGRQRRRRPAVVHFSGQEQEVRDAAAEVVASWQRFQATAYYRHPPASVLAELDGLRSALDASTAHFAEAVSNYLAGVAFWCDEPLKLAELRLRRTAYPLPDRAALRGRQPLHNAPLRTPRRPVVTALSVMPFRPGDPPVD
jgi:hypothetical protein